MSEIRITDEGQEQTDERSQFLIKAGVYLHRYGTPSHRIERVMSQVASALGMEGVFLYTPTALILSLRRGGMEQTYLRRVDSGALDVDKLIRFDETLEQLEAKQLTLREAGILFDEIANSASPFGAAVTCGACGLSCGAVAIMFGGGLMEVLVACLLGLSVRLLDLVHAALKMERGFLELVVGFFASVTAILISRFAVPMDDRLVTLASLIILIPGLGITVALTELAVGHLSAGVARLAGSCVSLLMLTIGVALGWRLAGMLRVIPEVGPWQLPDWCYWLAVAVAPLTFAIVFGARCQQWPTIFAVATTGVIISRVAGSQWGAEVGAFAGALAVGIGSNLYGRLRDRPALVPLMPGMIILVPGSLGYRSLTAFVNHETMIGIDFAVSMLIVGIALVGGILTANAVLPPKRIL